MDDGNFSDNSEVSKLILSDLLNRYIKDNKYKHKKRADMEYIHYKYIPKYSIADVNCLQSNMNRLTSDVFLERDTNYKICRCPLRD